MRLFAVILALAFTFSLPAWGQGIEDAKRCAAISDPDQALPYCNAAIESGQLSPEELAVTLINRGVSYSKKGNYDRAIPDFDQAIRLNPGLAYAFACRGTVYSYKGNYDRAIQDYDEAIRLDPSNVKTLYDRGTAYGYKGNFDRAILNYDQAIRLNPNYAKAFYNRGQAKRKLGDTAGGDADIAKAKQLDPKLP